MFLRDFILTDDRLFWYHYSLFLKVNDEFHTRQVDEAFKKSYLQPHRSVTEEFKNQYQQQPSPWR